MKSTFCPTCGEEVLTTDKFCSFCGISLQFTSWDRKAFIATLREESQPLPKHKQLIKGLKKLIDRKKDNENNS